MKLDPQVEAAQVAAIASYRSGRDGRAARDAVDAVQQAAAGTDNVMPPILGAVRAGCTLGEVADALRAVFGEYRERPSI